MLLILTFSLTVGFCFQFNSDGLMKSSTPGRAGGLKLTLLANTDHYSLGPYSYSEGFSVSSPGVKASNLPKR